MGLGFQTYIGLMLMCIASVVLGVSPNIKDYETPQVLAPGWSKLEYESPRPGTYKLPPLGKAFDAEVLVSTGESKRLFKLFGDRVVVLSFIYSTCNDPNGCPLSTAVLHKIRQRLDKEPELADKVRLVSLSFDPLNDTPEVMRLHGESFVGSAVKWDFVTTASEQALQPILDGYNQRIIKDYDENGDYLGTISHILRVYLIDRDRRIRNIYSVAFLHADVLVSDIKTILMEAGVLKVANTPDTGVSIGKLSRPGDYKEGYESSEYETRSLSVNERKGARADLLKIASHPPLGLPRVPIPEDNPLTAEKIELGRKLFYDRRLSLNDTFSCAMCHVPEQGFAHNELAMAVGIEGRTVRRNTPTIYNAAYLERLFHDGREHSLETQIWAPLLAKNEMGNPSVGAVIEKIKGITDYQRLFEAAFDKGPTMETIGMALASYQRTLISANSPFDRWFYGNRSVVLGDSTKRGFDLFTGKARCASCHVIGPDYALFTDHKLHNTGIGYYESMKPTPKTRKVTVAPGVVLDVDPAVYKQAAEKPPNDLGLYEVTQNPHDRWKYKTSSLRNIALTGPYMHNGSLNSLREVVQFYNRGGIENELLDPLISPLRLDTQEVSDLVSFLQALTGDNIDLLVSDAFAAPVGDTRREDPNWAHESRAER